MAWNIAIHPFCGMEYGNPLLLFACCMTMDLLEGRENSFLKLNLLQLDAKLEFGHVFIEYLCLKLMLINMMD